MTQLEKLKLLLNEEVPSNDAVYQFYLEDAKEIICQRRHTREVEPQYLNTQIKIAIELYNKRGAEGQISHNENNISRTYENANVSLSLLSEIIPVIRTPFSKLSEPEVEENENVGEENENVGEE